MSLLCFDLETTGVKPSEDRIVQAFLGLLGDDGEWLPGKTREWLINPGIPIPVGASDVHGYTTERIAEIGRTDIAVALEEIRQVIAVETTRNPLVIFNASFDATMLNAELVRHRIAPLDFGAIQIFDPMVIDKALYKFRKGSGMRKLVAIAPIYGVPVETNAHDAGADCLMTGRVLLRQLLLDPTITNAKQTSWKAEQSASLQSWFHSPKAGDRQDTSIFVNPGWPIEAAEPMKEASTTND
jgi:DNA polymerase-3 subunit epsilon